MIQMSELIKDPDYRSFLQKVPSLPAISSDKRMNVSPPWVVYVQREAGGKWGKKEFWTYKKAFKFFSRAMKLKVHDATINCKRIGYEPPYKWVRIKGKFVKGSDGKMRQATKRVYWKPKLDGYDEEHHWCKHCRRPTLFKYYAKHRRLGNVDPTVPRCCICGASARIAIHTPSDRFYRHQ